MGGEQTPPGQTPPEQKRQEQKQAPGQNAAGAQPRKPSPPRDGQGGAPKAIPNRRTGPPRSRKKEFMAVPFIFVFFIFGLVNLLATPVVYTYEIIAYNKKDAWPGWSGIDAWNYLFADSHLQVWKDVLFHGMPPHAVISQHENFLNDLLVGYLDLSVVFLCLLQGIVFLTLSIRTSIMLVGK